MRKSLENCAVESDIHLFVSMKKTGSDRPGNLNYFQPLSIITTGGFCLFRDINDMFRGEAGLMPSYKLKEKSCFFICFLFSVIIRDFPVTEIAHSTALVLDPKFTLQSMREIFVLGDLLLPSNF